MEDGETTTAPGDILLAEADDLIQFSQLLPRGQVTHPGPTSDLAI